MTANPDHLVADSKNEPIDIGLTIQVNDDNYHKRMKILNAAHGNALNRLSYGDSLKDVVISLRTEYKAAHKAYPFIRRTA